jgi:hypothetical protein
LLVPGGARQLEKRRVCDDIRECRRLAGDKEFFDGQLV